MSFQRRQLSQADFDLLAAGHQRYVEGRAGGRRCGCAGWRAAGKKGPKQECLDYIKEVWTDMRPLSLRKKMDAASGA